MSVYLRTKFQVYSIVVTSFRQRGHGLILPHPPPQSEPPKSPPILELKYETPSPLFYRVSKFFIVFESIYILHFEI